MHRVYLKIGAFIGALSVLMGAFAAHQLKQYVSAEVLSTFQTGVTYQFYHAFALLITGILLKRYPNDWIVWAGRLFVVGIILFSGSLYLLAMLKSIKDVGLGGFGLITPVGGLLLVAGWISLMVGIPANKPVSND
jgi:uncharacterized membrane protein YgdD (TMEM256/DUF423 family)